MFAEKSAQAEPPYVGHYLWTWFVELSSARTSNGFGPNPISFGEIGTWARLTGRDPTPWDVSVLRRMDMAMLSKLAKKSGKTQANEIEPENWEALDRALDRLG